MVKKFISEFVGTMLLVLFGCGTAVAANTYLNPLFGASLPFAWLTIACAFGLILTALVYTIGKVSGCHVNPAVTVACVIDKRISILDAVYYIIAQLLGAIVGAAIIAWIFNSNAVLGANGFAELSQLKNITTLPVALVVETILTFIFVLVVLSTTKKEKCNTGIVIGLTLTLVHILGIPFTGTSVNPARSLGPAILTGGVALEQLWVFIVAPLLGGILAALFYRYIASEEVSASEIPYEDDEDDEVETPESEEIATEEVEVEEKVEEEKPAKKTRKAKEK